MKIFSVLDVKANCFMKPFADSSSVQALRGFEIAVNESGSVFNRYPDDFCLMEVASFDLQSGVLVVLPSPLNLGSGRTVFREAPVQASLPLKSVGV